MRKVFLTLLLVILVGIALLAVWIFGGRRVSVMLDRYKTIEGTITPVTKIAYQGNGSGGVLFINNMALNLAPPDEMGPAPEIGTTKEEQLALSFDKKVFAFGPSESTSESETLSAKCAPTDKALLAIRHSALAWPNLFDFNFMTGLSGSWKRHQYYDLTWTKANGQRLELIWRYEQYFYRNQGWMSGLMTRPGETGLIRVEISSASR